YNGETKYIPFDFLTATGDERVEIIDNLISESINNVSYGNNNKSNNENDVQKSLKDNHYDIYNSFDEEDYPKSIICKSALQLAGSDLEKIPIAQSWCRENIADYDDIKWRIFENMYMYYGGGNHSALSTCTWAYLDDNKEVKKEPKLSHVLSWCSVNGISEEDIKNELGISDDKTKGNNSIYLILDAMLKRDGMSIERICSGEVTSGSGVNRQSFSSWCKDRWDKREQAMIKWMDNHIKSGNTAWDACRLAVGGKENKPDEYEVVIKWCNKHGVTEKDIKNEFSINNTYYAWGNIGNEVTVDPNMDNGPSPYRIVWEMGEKTFNIRKEEGTPSNRADSTENTYIIIHGWNEPYLNKCKDAVWPEKMAESILRTDPNAQVLRVDWGDITCTKSPTQASKWISSITDLTSEALKKWGVNGNKTTIIGFSLGTLLGEEISKEISGSRTIMLDPAEEGLFGYNIDYNNTSFSGFSGDERCIVGASSIFGDESATEYCKENYLVDYYDRYNHSKINELFKEFSINLGKGIAVDKFKNLSRNDIAWSYTVDGTKAIVEASAKYDDKYVVLGTVTGFLLDKTIEKGCTAAAAGTGPFAPATKLLCDTAISTAIDELQNAIIQTVTEHSWVHETYDTIIKYPFHDNILSLHDQQNFSLMNGGVFNV
ncbi:MAG: hypothetical protein KAH14_06765, partial [Clostridiales bacterium]|nr:hypothetical protein [Clostridiales bacterium]